MSTESRELPEYADLPPEIEPHVRYAHGALDRLKFATTSDARISDIHQAREGINAVLRYALANSRAQDSGGEAVAIVIQNVVGVEIAWINPPPAVRPPVGTKLCIAAEQPAKGEGDVYEAYKTWPEDIRRKLSLHDLRRMNGWSPRTNASDLEAKARAMFEQHNKENNSAPWEQQWEPTREHWRRKAEDDSDLPGMWERSDFSGGRVDVMGKHQQPSDPADAVCDCGSSVDNRQPHHDECAIYATPPTAQRHDEDDIGSVIKDLRHSAGVDGYTAQHRSFIHSIANRLAMLSTAHGAGAAVEAVEVLAALPDEQTLDAVDDDDFSGRRPCPIVLTIAQVRSLRRALSTQPLLSDQPGGVSNAMVERCCVAAYNACDMGNFPQEAIEPDGDRRFVRAVLEEAALHPEQAKDGAQQ